MTTTEEKEEFDTVKLLVEIRRRVEDDAIFSHHRPLSPGDQERMGSWPSGGLIHIAHALMVECFRREAYTMAVSMVSKGRNIQEVTPKDIDEATRLHVLEMMDQFLEGACQEAHERLGRGIAAQRELLKEALKGSESENPQP